MDLCKYTEELWKLYILGSMEENISRLFDMMQENTVIIGTGNHELYENLKTFREAFLAEEAERSQIQFRIHSFWCRERKLDEKNRFVYGSIHVKGTGSVCSETVDMNTRFTMIYSKCGETWKLVHIHQSLPDLDQMEGEYYPKSLMDQISESQMRINELEIQAKQDWLTGILNHQAFYAMSENLSVQHASGYFMVIDVDDFKQINDTYGHLYGDRVLKNMGAVLKQVIGKTDIAGRIGGDEFAVFCRDIDSDAEVEKLAVEIIQRTAESCQKENLCFWGISVGIARKTADSSSREALKAADKKMYEAKKNGKNNYRI